MNIYVGNLSYNTTEGALRDKFGAFGDVESVKIIKDQYSGRSKGFGFVTMPDDDKAQLAIKELNGKNIDGRDVKVNQARDREPPSRGGGRDRDRDR